MAIISLRAYNREIEGMIDNRQLDEAVAHCRHILATFPKHIASYRLLGKTHLEQQRISDATDIFQRVLSAMPDDFVSNVGMSIIREDENNLDAAIWHMELAYEAQPANVAIQDELRRLYGRRDGMQPPRVRLTRGALARMYAKGGLFDQSIAELRAAINEDPNRPDLQLLLAQMLFQTSQRVDAVDTCMSILKKMPLCLEANRILAVSLPEAENSGVVKNSRQLVISMDPYYAFAEPDAITSDQVPDNAVTIERLEYRSGIQVGEVPEQPAWATSLGISMEKQADENIPEWLKAVEAPSTSPAAENAPQGVSPFIWDTQEVENIITDTSKPEGEIPDWMKDAGWKPSSGEAQPPPAKPATAQVSNADAAVNEDLVQADIPEWLRGIAPDGFTGAQGQQFQAEEDKLSNPWLEPHQPGPTDSIIQWLEEEKPVSSTAAPAQKEDIILPPEDEVPDWLKDLDVPQAEEKERLDIATPAAAFTAGLSAFMQEAEQTEEVDTSQLPQEPQEKIQPEMSAQDTALPLTGDEETQAQAIPAEEEELPDWLKDLSVEQAASEDLSTFEIGVPEEASVAEPKPPIDEAIGPAVEEAAEPSEPAAAPVDSILPEVAAGFIAAEMISKITEESPAAQEEAPEKPEAAVQPAPDVPIREEAQSLEAPEAESVSPQIPEEFQPEQEAVSADQEITTPEPEAFAWLKGLADEQDAQEEQAMAGAPDGDLEPPDWVKLDMEPEQQEAISAEPAPEVELPTEPEEEVPEWIKGLGEETEAVLPEEQPVEAGPTEMPEGVEEELPAWIAEMEQPEMEQEIPGSQEEALEWEPEELPAWLKEITESEQEGEEEAAEPVDTGEIAKAALAAALISESRSKQEGRESEEPSELPLAAQPAEVHAEEPASPEAPVIEQVEPAIQEEPEAVPAEEAEEPELIAQGQAMPDAEQAAQAELVDARNAISRGEPSQAVNSYTNLIKQNFHLDEIIKDLQEALYRYPVDVDMWVTLGDAHSKTNDLQEALNAYAKAEELVR